MPEVLECWLHGDHVGRFERQTGRAARLVYDADATRVVSLSLPIDAPAPDGAAEHYLRGLLPEDPVALRDMMRASGATSTDTFELLRQVGGDVAGAVQLTAPGSEPRSDPDHEPLIASTSRTCNRPWAATPRASTSRARPTPSPCCAAIGNADAHAKNYSIMLENEPRLSPLYDLVPLGAYPQYSQRLTMPIGSRRHTGNITLKDWNALAVDCDLEPDHVVNIVSDVNQRLSSQLEPAFGEFAARHSNLGKALRQMQRYMARNI